MLCGQWSGSWGFMKRWGVGKEPGFKVCERGRECHQSLNKSRVIVVANRKDGCLLSSNSLRLFDKLVQKVDGVRYR